MANNQIIQEWLNSTLNYDAGVQLYNQYGSDALLKLLFSEGWSEFKEKRLLAALELLATSAHVPDQANDLVIDQLLEERNELAAERDELEQEREDLELERDELEEKCEELNAENQELKQQVTKAGKGWPAIMDATIQQLHDTWKPLIAEKYHLQARIYEVAKAGLTNEEKRKEACTMAHRILDLRDECRAIYKMRDHYLQHGALPTEQQPDGICQDYRKWPTKLANHQKYLRDYKAKHAKETDPEKRKQLEAHITKQEEMVTAYKKLLGDAV